MQTNNVWHCPETMSNFVIFQHSLLTQSILNRCPPVRRRWVHKRTCTYYLLGRFRIYGKQWCGIVRDIVSPKCFMLCHSRSMNRCVYFRACVQATTLIIIIIYKYKLYDGKKSLNMPLFAIRQYCWLSIHGNVERRFRWSDVFLGANQNEGRDAGI